MEKLENKGKNRTRNIYGYRLNLRQREGMIKLKVLFLIMLLSNLCSKAQVNDTINPSQIFIIGVKEFKNPILLIPNRKFNEKKIPWELLSVVIEKGKMKDFSTTKVNKFRYISLNANCYITGLWFNQIASFVHEQIIPIVPQEYLPLLTKTYPNPNVEDKDIYGDIKKYNKKYKYRDITCHKYLLVLVHAPLYNHYTYDRIRPPAHRFRGDKAEQGIYFKLLIPLIE